MGVSLTLDVHESRASVSHGAVRPAFVVCNHRSALDILLLCAHFGGALLSRADLAKWPMIGFVARRAGTIFVEREATKSRISAMRQIRETLGSGRGVCLFPEGGTYDGDEVRPFFPGGFAAARGLDVDIVPVGLAYPDGFEFGQHSFADHARQVASRSQNPVAMVVGRAQANLPKAADAAEHFRSEVQTLTHRARSLLQTAAPS